MSVKLKALEALWEYCWCDGRLRKENLHEQTCIFSRYIPDSFLSDAQQQAIADLLLYREGKHGRDPAG